MSLFRKKRQDADSDDDEIRRRFEELAAATPELGGFGPRDWSPAEDTEGFVQPDPPLPRLHRSTIRGWVLFVIGITGLCLLGIFRPAYSSIMAILCLLVLAWSFYILMFKK